jgi:hypothetical protein
MIRRGRITTTRVSFTGLSGDQCFVWVADGLNCQKSKLNRGSFALPLKTK